MNARSAARSIAGIVTGLIVISLVVEAVEFALVTIVHSGITITPSEYFGIRNGTYFLMAKFVYSAATALVGGYVAQWIAKGRPIVVGLTLAVIQAGFMIWAMFQPSIAAWTPAWVSIWLIISMSPAIVLGSALRDYYSRK